MYLEGTSNPYYIIQQRRFIKHVYCWLVINQYPDFVHIPIQLFHNVVIMHLTRLQMEQCIFVDDLLWANKIHDSNGVEGEAKLLCAIVPFAN